ncbi:hypothetical protein V7S43_014336 [Phytophthora oleae]|uniref:Crinkler effector protein N-terminal domain-containing protein n=1 Tax=Phytophthora oleae TaxID=2107226 RepID=A0ABD3F4H7_9STRA
MKLFCVIVGETGITFDVEIEGERSVEDLKDAIMERNRNKLKDVDAVDLRLFLATKKPKEKTKEEKDEEGSDEEKWLTQKLRHMKVGQLGEVSEDAAGGLGPVHVVVEIAEEKSVTRKTRARSENDDQRPVKRLKATEVEKWEWTEEEPVYYRKGRLFFVNREKAVQDLVKFHERKFKRANQGIGDTWVIPLLDNDYGFGKTRFGSEYIRRCQSLKSDLLKSDSTKARGFMDTLCSCHTIRIVLNQMQVLDENGGFQAKKASRSLIDCILIFFQIEYGIVPQAFDNLEENYEDILRDLTEEVGPLFIVIDEIGLAFGHNKLDDFVRSEQFIKFCKVLQPLFEIRKLFFLIAGRASFLNHVARRPLGTGSITTNSPFLFKRLDLHLLRHEAIKTIIKNTRWEEATSDTIQDHLQLTEDQVTKAADHLFDTTLGHPRSLLVAFKACGSYDELLTYAVPEVPSFDGLAA